MIPLKGLYAAMFWLLDIWACSNY